MEDCSTIFGNVGENIDSSAFYCDMWNIVKQMKLSAEDEWSEELLVATAIPHNEFSTICNF